MTASDSTAAGPHESAGGIAIETLLKQTNAEVTARSRQTSNGTETIYYTNGRTYTSVEALAEGLRGAVAGVGR